MRQIITVILAILLPQLAGAVKYAGGDISLLPEYENAGAVYLTQEGQRIDNLLEFNRQKGMNIMRVRLFVDPAAYNGPDDDPNACQNLEYITPLCRRIKDAGFALMLDFHYSDTWADPAKQWTPASWVSLTDDELYQKIYDYTRSVLTSLREAGAEPDFIQTGNEISYGMLWGAWSAPESSLKKCFINSNANWPRFLTLLKRAGEACREVCPEAKIVIHTERVPQPSVLDNFYGRMKEAQLDYDIIGLSYYPYFHGPLGNLETALNLMEKNYPGKDIMIVETGYPYAWEIPGTTYPECSKTWAYSAEGQAAFTRDLVALLKKHDKVNGVIWWWAEYNAYRTSLSGWYNAPLFDSRNGRALPAIDELCGFADNTGSVEGVAADGAEEKDPVWHNLQGQRIPAPDAPGIYIRNNRKVVVR